MKALIYCRVSTTKQGEDGSSLDSQLAACESYAADQGYAVAGIYRETYSGAYLYDRPQLEKLRARVREEDGDIKVVIVHSVDRLSRNLSHLFIIIEELERHNAKALFVTEAFDSTAEGKLLQSVKSYVAEVEREKIRERTMRGRLSKIKDGTISNRRPLYGYILTKDGRREPCPDTSHVVQEMFARMADGGSLRSISADLNARGIPTPTGKGVWWGNSIAVILKNPAYTGKVTMFRYKHRSKTVKGRRTTTCSYTAPDEWIAIENSNTTPLVSEDQFKAVQVILDHNKKAKRRQVKMDYLLRGMVTCAVCGRFMSPQMSKTYRSYVCTSKQSPTTNCGVRMLGADRAEGIVWQKIEQYIREPEILRQMVDDALREIGSQTSSLADELRAVERSITRCRSEIKRMETNLIRADPRSFDDMNKLLSREHDELERLGGMRDDIVRRHQARTAASQGIETIIERATRTIEQMKFRDRVNLLRAFGLQAKWDGATLKANIYAPYFCQSDPESFDNKTVSLALDL